MVQLAINTYSTEKIIINSAKAAPVADVSKIQEIERNTESNVRPKLCHIFDQNCVIFDSIRNAN